MLTLRQIEVDIEDFQEILCDACVDPSTSASFFFIIEACPSHLTFYEECLTGGTNKKIGPTFFGLNLLYIS